MTTTTPITLSIEDATGTPREVATVTGYTAMNRSYSSNSVKAEFEAREAAASADRPRVWAVRAGSTGTGQALFDVYAEDMTDARLTVLNWAQEVGSVRLSSGDFTVHAGQSAGPLKDNPLADMPHIVTDWADNEEFRLTHEVRMDTVVGLVDATYLNEDQEGMVLVLVGGQLQEHPADALRPQCECGNPFSLCHPDA